MSSSFDDIQHPVARKMISEQDAAHAQLQEHAEEFARQRSNLVETNAFGNNELTSLVSEMMDMMGGRMRDIATEGRAEMRRIADMQRAEEAAEEAAARDETE